MVIKVREKVKQAELPVLAGILDYLRTMVGIEREIEGERSYIRISRTMEESINAARDIADRLLYAGLEGEDGMS